MQVIFAFINVVSTKILYIIELGHMIELLVIIKRTIIMLEEGLFAKEYLHLSFKLSLIGEIYKDL